MEVIRKIARGVLRALPDDGRLIRQSVRKLRLRKELALGKLAQQFLGMTLPDPRTVYWINPAKIEYATCLGNGSFDWEDWVLPQHEGYKPVRSGDWDLLRHKFEEMRVARAIEARMQGEDWSTTDYYRFAVRQIESGRHLWGCNSRSDFDAHCVRVDRLFESISRDGYHGPAALGAEGRSDTLVGQSEILVNVSRDGYPMFQDGRHRLAIARALGLSKIPCQVFVRHAEWQTFRELMHRMAKGHGGAAKRGLLYQKAPHFDLADIPAEHSCEDRWTAIAPHLPDGGGRALDIGANLGFFSHGLEQAGFETTAVEYEPTIALAASRIATAEKRSIRVIQGDVLSRQTLEAIGYKSFSVVLAINIFHHFIKTEDGFNRLREFVRAIRTKVMIFEPHHPSDPQMIGRYSNPAPDEFARMIADWGGLQNLKPIYDSTDGRMVYKLM